SCGEPLLEDVDAVVMWPEQRRETYRFRRLVLPFKRRDGSSVLLGTTLHDPDIDLRIKRNQELLQVLQQLLGVQPAQTASRAAVGRVVELQVPFPMRIAH